MIFMRTTGCTRLFTVQDSTGWVWTVLDYTRPHWTVQDPRTLLAYTGLHQALLSCGGLQMGVTRVMGLTALTGVRGVTGACKVEKGPVKDNQVENGKKVWYSDRPETT